MTRDTADDTDTHQPDEHLIRISVIDYRRSATPSQPIGGNYGR